MRPHDRSASAGFTLIETMMALFVIGILSISGASMLLTTLQAGRQVEASSEALADLQVAYSLLRDDLTAVTARETAPPTGLEAGSIFLGREGRGDGPLLTFTRDGWADPGELAGRSDLQRIEYALENGVLLRRSWARPDAVGGTPRREQQMIAGLKDVEARYMLAEEWSETWISDSTNVDIGLPDAVELTLTFSGDDSIVALFKTGGGP